MKPSLNQLPETIKAPRTDPIYNCHGYLTKVPVAAIEPFIIAFTEPGETVADFFAGSGMTGLAAVRLGRSARLSDISVLGRHIAEGYSRSVSPVAFRAVAERVVSEARAAVGDLYSTRRGDDKVTVEMVRTVWSFTYRCPSCGYHLVYLRHLSKQGAPPKKCPECSAPFIRRKWLRESDVPVEVVSRNAYGRLTEQPVSDFDRKMIGKAAADPRQKDVPSLRID